MATQRPSQGIGVFRTPRTIALAKGVGPKLEDADALCTTCGVPNNAPGHSGHYEERTDAVVKGGVSGAPARQFTNTSPFKLGGK